MEQYSAELFDKARSRIYHSLLEKDIDEIEQTVLDIITELDGRGSEGIPFDEWSIEKLLSAQGRLSILRVNLGIAASRAAAKSNHIMRWKIYQSSKEWIPLKTKLQKEFDQAGKKLLKGDIEAVLVEGLWETTQREVFQQEVADRFKSVFDATNQVLTSIKMQINHKTQEAQQAKYNEGA